MTEKGVVIARKENRGGRNRIDYFITVDCFKHVCMRSSSKKGQEVRTYFIELDNFVSIYTQRIVEGLLKKLNKLEKKERQDGSGWIYIFRAGGKVMKIGHTDNLAHRFSGYNTGRAKDVKPLFTFETKNRKKAEDCVKAFCKAKRFKKRRKLYEVDEDIVHRIMGMCKKVGDVQLEGDETWSAKERGSYYVMFANKDDPQPTTI